MNVHTVGPFVLGKTLGTGSTGKVKLGFHKENGMKVAIKIISKEYLVQRPTMLRKVEREIAVMKLVDNVHIMRLYDVYETTKYLFLILEHVEGGELFDYLVSRGALDPSEARVFFQQIIAGLDYCHNHMICHRDLKPENLLLDGQKSIKICDFGMASLMKQGNLLSTSCGSPHYASPEVIMGIQYDGFAADVWSCGVILYALLTGKLPFDDENIRSLLAKVKSGEFEMPSFLHPDSQDLIRKMLVLDPKKRITISQIRQHPWFNANHLCVPITPNIENTKICETIDPIDDEIFRSLVCLGFSDEEGLYHSLISNQPNIEKAFYFLLDERKNNPHGNPDQANSVPPTPQPQQTLSPPQSQSSSSSPSSTSSNSSPPSSVPAQQNSVSSTIQSSVSSPIAAHQMHPKMDKNSRSNSVLSPMHQLAPMRRVTSSGNRAGLLSHLTKKKDNNTTQNNIHDSQTSLSNMSPVGSPRDQHQMNSIHESTSNTSISSTSSTRSSFNLTPGSFMQLKLETKEEAQRSWFSSFLGGSRKPDTLSQSNSQIFSTSHSLTGGQGVGGHHSGGGTGGGAGADTESTRGVLERQTSSSSVCSTTDSVKAANTSPRKRTRSTFSFYSGKQAATGGAFGLVSRKPPEEVINELKRTLTALNITFRYIKKGNSIKAKCKEGNNKVKFVIEVTLLQEGGDVLSSFISFVRTHGDMPTYRVVCKKIEDEISLK